MINKREPAIIISLMGMNYAPVLSGMEEVPGWLVPQRKLLFTLPHALIQHGFDHIDEAGNVGCLDGRDYPVGHQILVITGVSYIHSVHFKCEPELPEVAISMV